LAVARHRGTEISNPFPSSGESANHHPEAAGCGGFGAVCVATLATQFGGLIRAASALGFSSIRAMQDAIMAYCGG